jgi:stage III sporulation protein SpoIIIAA
LQKVVADDLDELLDVLPPRIRELVCQQADFNEFLEIVMDLGRLPEVRFLYRELVLGSEEIHSADIDYVISRVGQFSGDNRAGIERTLHRISAIRNRSGRIIGLTCRVGRAVFGTVNMIQNLVESKRSVLLLGRPGVGKTTMLREIARVLADDLKRRVIVIDTSNEIAGDGDIPHPAIGHARRMQVTTPAMQHAVMIEAVENHMPEVIIIDEIGTELEAQAARTIAERGVQLVGTAHGNTLENLIMNPTLSDLIGGIQTVTLGDEEAKRRHTQKSILERKAPPTFDIVVEILDYHKVLVHPDVVDAVDAALHQQSIPGELRWMDENGEVKTEEFNSTSSVENSKDVMVRGMDKIDEEALRFYLFGVNRTLLQQLAGEERRKIRIVADLEQADIFLTTRSYYRKKSQKIRDAERLGISVYVLRNNSIADMKQCLSIVFPSDSETCYIHRLQNLIGEHRSIAY